LWNNIRSQSELVKKVCFLSQSAAGYPFPRFRALALLGRRLPERMDGSFIPASEKPAQKQTSTNLTSWKRGSHSSCQDICSGHIEKEQDEG
jgi:hypothetical protein